MFFISIRLIKLWIIDDLYIIQINFLLTLWRHCVNSGGSSKVWNFVNYLKRPFLWFFLLFEPCFALTIPVPSSNTSTRVFRRYQLFVLTGNGTECLKRSKLETTSSFLLFPTITNIYRWLIKPTFDFIRRSPSVMMSADMV